MNPRAVKIAACYALLVVCLVSSAILSFLAVISLSIVSELYDRMPGITLNYQLYSPWLFVLPGLSALCLLAACVKTLRSLNTGKTPGNRVLLAPWIALLINFTLCISCSRGAPHFGAVPVVFPLLAAALNICTMFLIGSVNKEAPE